MYLSLVATSSLGRPTFISALLFGLITVMASWFILQPGLGMGVLARNAPDPWLKRMNSLIIHSVFGMAIFVFWNAFIEIFL